MTPDEAARLLAACAAFDNRQPSEIAKRAWARALHKIPLDDDCYDAVARYYATPAKDGARLWIQPADVITHRNALRAERLENFVYEPPAGQLDDPDYIRRLRGQRYAVGSGHVPAPATAPALTGGPAKTVADMLAGVGRPIPDDDATAAVRRPGPLGTECPKCSAPIGRPCRTPGGKERAVHPARRGEGTDPQTEAAEIERRRAASARHLANQEPTP